MFLQIFSDVYNGFGGISSQLLEDLRDEYGNKSFLTFGVTPSEFPKEMHKGAVHRILNSALSFGQLALNSDLFVPMSLSQEVWPHLGQARDFPLLDYKVI